MSQALFFLFSKTYFNASKIGKEEKKFSDERQFLEDENDLALVIVLQDLRDTNAAAQCTLLVILNFITGLWTTPIDIHILVFSKSFQMTDQGYAHTVLMLLQLLGPIFQNGFLGGVQFKYGNNLTNFY